MLRIIAILFLCFIIVNLVMGLVSLIRDQSKSTATVKALTWRVGLSLLLFIFIVVAAFFDQFPS